MQNCTAVDEALRQHAGLEATGFVQELLPKLMELVRAAKRLPVGEEHAVRRGSRDFLSSTKDLGSRSLAMMHRVLCFVDKAQHGATGAEELAQFDAVVDSIDSVLERVDASLRVAKAPADVEKPAWTPPPTATPKAWSKEKPQAAWRHLVDNNRKEFVPRLLQKHNAKAPLDRRLVAAQRRAGMRPGEAAQAAEEGKGETGTLPHPYEEELRALSQPENLFEVRKPQQPARMEDTPLILIEGPDALREMVREIKATCQGQEIAVDVEHHDFRSYRGFVCLVQLSTRQKDYLLDPFAMFEEMHELNEIFSDPGILKVLHGADSDVKWLQRDFSVYLVNMFDTGLATRALHLQGGYSLANLVQHCCGVQLEKKYQLADWRERPLPADFKHYARCDTHYLLYCFDVLRNTLLAHVPNLGIGSSLAIDIDVQATEDGVLAMKTVLEKSTALCCTQYEESALDVPFAAMKLCGRFSSKTMPLQKRQFAALQALMLWRDELARRLDESWNLIAPDGVIWRVALALPGSPSALRATCNPLPRTLQEHAVEVVALINSAEDAATQPAAAADAERTQDRAQAPVAVVQEAFVPPAPLELREWPTVELKPTVHVASGNAAPALPALFAALAGSATLEGVSALMELRAALKFATEPPEPPAPREKEEAVPVDDAMQDLLRLLPQSKEGGGDEEGVVEGVEDVEVVDLAASVGKAVDPSIATAEADAPLLASVSRKKRRRQGTAKHLDEVAISDPYGSAAAEPIEIADEAVAAPSKRRKRRAVQQVVDPYL